jgi:hypothetical protein
VSDKSIKDGQPPLHPELESLLAFWFVKCAGRKMPARRDLPLAEWERWHRNLALFEVIQYGALRIYECRLSAADLGARFACEATGLALDDLQPDVRAELRAGFENACEKKAPVIVAARVLTGSAIVNWSELILPLSDNDARVDALLFASYPAKL